MCGIYRVGKVPPAFWPGREMGGRLPAFFFFFLESIIFLELHVVNK